jgi:uncharacterized caspase-like protein
MPAARGTLVAYATSPGAVAVDGSGRNGVYTTHLLCALREPGLPVEHVLQRVRTGVTAETQGVQIPWETAAVQGDLILHPAGTATPGNPSTADASGRRGCGTGR